jgi:hypothetical protein
MLVQVFPTPNPNAHKFTLPGVRFERSFNFPSVESASAHPLAASLFEVGGVYNVLLAQDFVTVNKLPDVDWEVLDPVLIERIQSWLERQPSSQP